MAKFPEEVQIFSADKKEELFQSTSYSVFYPNAVIEENRPIQITVPPSSEAYILDSFRILAQVQVVKQDGSELTSVPEEPLATPTYAEVDEIGEDTNDTEKAHTYYQKCENISKELKYRLQAYEQGLVKSKYELYELPFFCDNILESLISSLDIELNDCFISEFGTLNSYQYLAWLRCMLSSPEDGTFDSESDQFTTDTPTESERLILDTMLDSLPGMTISYPSRHAVQKRSWPFRESHKVNLVSRISHSLFHSNHRILMPGNRLRFTFRLAEKDFYFTSDECSSYKVELVSLRLRVKTVEIKQAAMNILKQRHRTTPCLYPLQRNKLLTFSLDPGRSHFVWNLALQHQRPDMMIFGLMETDRYVGDISMSPFVFRLEQIQSLHLSLNGSVLGGDAAQYRSQEDCREAFSQLQSQLGVQNMISYEAFRLYCGLFAFSLQNLAPDVEGSLKFELQLKNPLAENWTLLVFLLKDDTLKLHENSTVTY